MTRGIVLAILSIALLGLPTATAHVTVTATAPTGPIPWDAPTTIPVEISANCAVVLAEYDAMGKTQLEIALKEGSPAWVTGKGDKVPFTATRCGNDGNVRSKGNLVITPSELAPGLQEVSLFVVAKGEAGEAAVPITISYRGILDVVAPGPDLPVTDGAAVGEILLNASLNSDSMAMIEVVTPPQYGTLELATSLDIPAALVDNLTGRTVPLPFAYTVTPGANFTMDMVKVRVFMHAATDPGSASEPQEFMLHFMAPDHPMDHEGHHELESANPIPAGGLPALLLAVLGFALLRRRHA